VVPAEREERADSDSAVPADEQKRRITILRAKTRAAAALHAHPIQETSR
jgi:hypothetical protein